MDWLTFFASVISSISWPIALVALVLALRRPLNQLLPGLSHLRYRDFELKFGKELAQARAEIEAAPAAPQAPAPVPQATPGEAEYVRTLAEVSPRAAILEAWLPFETIASRAGESIGLSPERRPLQMPRLIDGLKRDGLLTEEEGRAVTRLRGIRNEIVHAPVVDLPKDSVIEYVTVLRRITSALEQRLAARCKELTRRAPIQFAEIEADRCA